MATNTETAITRVEAYLRAMEDRELDRAADYVRMGGVEMTFPGGRRFTAPAQIAANSGGRYARIGKTIARRSAWQEDGRVHVLISGTLHGAWPDGTAFDGIRFVDLFALEDGLIVRQEVWNDSAEHLAAR